MPKVPLTATRDFTYMTRRLTAGDPFEARNPLEAKILTRVRKVAEVPSTFSVPEAEVNPIEKAEPEPAKVEAPLPSTEIKPGKPGGSKLGQQARKRKAKAKK